MMEAVLSTLIPEGTRGVVPHTGEFRALMAEAAAKRDLSGIDMERVNLEPMREAVRRAAADVTKAAVDAGRAVDPAAVRAAAEGRSFRKWSACTGRWPPWTRLRHER